ncbi:bacterial regulatory, Fis family protein [Clostridium argentinense CDC 2741]|uniref:Stage 0 sporulation protein A homolog n=1 Tax=Clostridium argentinense CDC 2741 TaxID=1418104 RepID=A0A0C1U6Z3_9CLOT|nr:sigma-54 dependent transcriptional regulator [Clostridium argentinense]ARC83272.1 sigma-54-dependent Fis family transcriptional regulator [Clostridium argentinense]KIE48504.1 bacterial regulatory, Fis family protein [Clostridium argentinense CDC 2741]NFF41850.1 sigma-54-dependent Fis family transcriptional regulator [Clostridium argentinense]NFP52528.1 sigma-54-dependent Fis family transcriptional regulator [Clostridium argentinense]NFP74898.1 sigma-54-dependent Fis family transcriptional r
MPNKLNKILMIDDDESFLKIHSRILQSKGYDVHTAINGEYALTMLKNEPYAVVICDIVMPGIGGIDVLNKIKNEYIDVQVIMLTGEASISGAVEAMTFGAYTYLVKPLNIEEFLLNVERAVNFYNLNTENRILKNRIESMEKRVQLLGNSAEIEEIKRNINIVASANSTILITGESGTGKEIVANLLHQNSSCSNGALVKVNCAALSESILESELFGHERGAFTGAISTKIGRFEIANGGTLFLDEIGEISLKLQSKLLRVLQEKEFERVGSTKIIKANFRLIAATNKNLAEEVAKGTFREDLFYRINVVPIHMPPLKDRLEDIPILLNHFLQYFCSEMRKPFMVFSDEALKILLEYSWPGNVRELRNLVERLVVFSSSTIIHTHALPKEVKNEEITNIEDDKVPFLEAKKNFEKNYITQALKRNDWNISATAKQINIARKNLQLKIKQLDLSKDDTKM